MKKSPWFFLVPVGIVVAVIMVLLYFLHPLGPVVLLISLAIQVPIIWVVTRTSMTKGYEDRAYERRQQFQIDGDAQAFLEMEEQEAGGAGFTYWSRRAKSLSALNRAELLTELDRQDEAAVLLADVDTKAIDRENRRRFDEAVEKARAKNAARYDARDAAASAQEPSQDSGPAL